METLELIAEHFHATSTQLTGTALEIATSVAPAIMAQIDKYDNAEQRALNAQNFMSGTSIADIYRTIESMETIKAFFQTQTVCIEDEHGNIQKRPSVFAQIPVTEIRNTATLINSIKKSRDE